MPESELPAWLKRANAAPCPHCGQTGIGQHAARCPVIAPKPHFAGTAYRWKVDELDARNDYQAYWRKSKR